jgi:hypothetical protein
MLAVAGRVTASALGRNESSPICDVVKRMSCVFIRVSQQRGHVTSTIQRCHGRLRQRCRCIRGAKLSCRSDCPDGNN